MVSFRDRWLCRFDKCSDYAMIKGLARVRGRSGRLKKLKNYWLLAGVVPRFLASQTLSFFTTSSQLSQLLRSRKT